MVRTASRSGWDRPLPLLHSLSLHPDFALLLPLPIVKAAACASLLAEPTSIPPPATCRVVATSIALASWTMRVGRNSVVQEFSKWGKDSWNESYWDRTREMLSKRVPGGNMCVRGGGWQRWAKLVHVSGRIVNISKHYIYYKNYRIRWKTQHVFCSCKSNIILFAIILC